MKRRKFLEGATAVAGLTSAHHILPASASSAQASQKRTRDVEMPYRNLGRTRERISVIGLGGYHIGVQRDEVESIRLIRASIDRGINLMDNCWDYNEGASEIRMGKALRDGYRERVFLTTKIDGRTHEAAARQIDESLRRLQTDRVDLMHIHEVIRLEDPDRCFSQGGAIKALLAAKKAGKIRYIGFTGHKDPFVHLRMLEVARDHNFRFDAMQLPLNVMDAHFRSFERQVLPVLVREQMGVLGMKALGGGVILGSKTVTPTECLHYALSLPTSSVITGMESLEQIDQAMEAVRTFKPLTSEQRAALLSRTREAAARGRFELFKTTDRFDGTARNPQWLG
jgi:predicted aldo/keto reductase-like oxidoreductase